MSNRAISANRIMPAPVYAEEFLEAGSLWLRWDPHLHTPKTVLNNQFGQSTLDDWIKAVNAATPAVRALGVTDYCVLDSYEIVQAAKAGGDLGNCDFIFPNIELRLDVATAKGKFVNIHLLINPEDADHVEQARRFLRSLTFAAYSENFCCDNADLMRLGRRAKQETLTDRAALEHGVNQFKISIDKLRAAYIASAWARKNIIFAVSGNQTDGTSGVRAGADMTLREEIEKFCHAIFTSDPNQRNFWLGKRALNKAEIKDRYDGLKPCLHGSDAHDLQRVTQPAESRYTWIKGAPSFDALQQACIDPEGRAFVGEAPPITAMPSQVVASVEIEGAEWITTPNIKLNPGLVTIIGARGSGKTALAEMIAVACNAVPKQRPKGCFLERAAGPLSNCSITIRWSDEDREEKVNFDGSLQRSDEYAKARYLSQQFVNELCSPDEESDGVNDKLLGELERVIYESHELDQKAGASNFEELLEIKASRSRAQRRREEISLDRLCVEIGSELDKTKLVGSLIRQVQEKTLLIENYTADRSALIPKGGEAWVERLSALSDASGEIRRKIRAYTAQENALNEISDEVQSFRKSKAPEDLRKLKDSYRSAGFTDAAWNGFLLKYTGEVEGTIEDELTTSKQMLKVLQGEPVVIQDGHPLLTDNADLSKQPLSILTAETQRVQNLINANDDVRKRYEAVSLKITEETILLTNLQEKLADCQGAEARAETLRTERDKGYVEIFNAIIAEEKILKGLYFPVMAKLDTASGTLNKVAFTVKRVANVEEWASEGEKLFDLRRAGPLKRKGKLRSLAQPLKLAWEAGDTEAVSSALNAFRKQTQEELLQFRQDAGDDQTGFRAWVMRYAKWLYGTGHIEIIYSIDYDGVDIRKLSPGTRGIVLLLLYLALDDKDDRPLIIDQPEENLDPRSVYTELVQLFIKAKSQRQVIMVTHNANLVVNTDADQIIIASAGPRGPDGMPVITYQTGGLEDKCIREQVCEILEGGREAFLERARRLRVPL